MSIESKKYLVWGSSGHARVIAEMVSLLHGEVVAVFDNDENAKPVVAGVPLFYGESGLSEWIERNRGEVAPLAHVAIGGGRGLDRLEILRLFEAHGIGSNVIVHPDASVSGSAEIGNGSQVLARCVIAAGVEIGEGCIINHGSSVDHETILGPGCHIAPGATLCGCVRIGSNVFVGAGATILPRITVGSNAVIGAGSVVTKDIPDSVVAYGNPCRINRINK